MTLVDRLAEYEAEVPGSPPAEFTVAPRTIDDAAAILDVACEHRLGVVVWGGATHQGYGHAIEPGIVLSTHRMNRIIDWSPEDLVAVVEAGVAVAEFEGELGERGQSAMFAEAPGAATVGGSIAAGISGWRRLRYGPIRDRVLETTVATGDGRVIRAGGRVVKNVTGYDIPRLMTGSFGSLGVIGSVALKLWPVPMHRTTVSVGDAAATLAAAYRPWAVVETNESAKVYLAGTEAALEEQTAQVDGVRSDGHQWPDPLEHETVLVVRVPPSATRSVVDLVRSSWSFQASHGVGEIRIGSDAVDVESAAELRSWAEHHGGAVVAERLGGDLRQSFDPWGTPPPALGLQRSVKAAFDPIGVCNPGRLPGGL